MKDIIKALIEEKKYLEIRKQFNEYARELAELGFNKSIYFYIYYWSLFLFGTRFNDTMIRTLKKIIGRRPKL